MIQKILSRLEKVRSQGHNVWSACCPAHPDKNPSLAIKLTNDDRILIKCFAGCEAIEIIHAIGLELKDLFPKYGLNPTGTMQKIKQDYEYQTAKQNELEHAKIIMALYESDKKRGVKHSRHDREKIIEAYEILRNENRSE